MHPLPDLQLSFLWLCVCKPLKLCEGASVGPQLCIAGARTDGYRPADGARGAGCGVSDAAGGESNGENKCDAGAERYRNTDYRPGGRRI